MAAKTKMVRVKMVALAAGPAGSYEAGKEYEIAADIAQGYVKGGYAILVEDPAAKAQATVVDETVVDETVVDETVVDETVVNETVVNETAEEAAPKKGTRKAKT